MTRYSTILKKRPACGARRGAALLNNRHADISRVGDDPESVQEPEDHRNHHHDIEDRLDRRLHGDEPVDEPEEHTDDNQGKYHVNEGHRRPLILIVRCGSAKCTLPPQIYLWGITRAKARS